MFASGGRRSMNASALQRQSRKLLGDSMPISRQSLYFSTKSICCLYDPRDDEKLKTHSLLIPRISILPLSRRYHSTSQEKKSTSSTSLASDHNKEEEDNQKSVTDETKYRARAARARQALVDRAGVFSDSAKDQYATFKQNPREISRKGFGSAKDMAKKYGPVFVGTYLGVYLATLGSLFLGVESGALDPVQLFDMLGHGADGGGETKNTVEYVLEFMNKHEWLKPWAKWVEKKPELANLAVAWIAVKFTEPLRLPISLYITPRIARYFGYKTIAVEEEHIETKADPK